MADKVHVSLGGLPYQASDPEQAAQMVQAGGQVMSEEQAREAAGAQADLSYVDQNWGATGKFGMGVGSGLTLGLAPGLLAQAGLLNPGHAHAAQTSPWYTAGDVAGTIAPALLSGGEALGARSALSGALRASPAGLMELGGSLSERLAAGLVGDSPGILGKLGRQAVGQAARGATEGALINLGHTVGENLIDNKPLSAQAMAAAGVDGALFGGLIGGSVGTVGALGGQAVEGLQSIGKAAVGKGQRAMGIAASKGFGMPVDAVVEAGENLPGKLKSYNDVLEKGGSKVGDSDVGKLTGVRSALKDYKAGIEETTTSFSKSAPAETPKLSVVFERQNLEVLHPVVGTPVQEAVAKELEKVQSQLHAIEPTWGKWVQSRNELQKMVHGSGSELQKSVLKDTLRIVDDEIGKSMDGAVQLHPELAGLADKYRANVFGKRVAEELEGHLGKKAAAKMLSTEPSVTPRDMAMTAASAVSGSPLMGLTWLASKGLVRQLSNKLEPAIAQMAYDASIGGKASGATLQAKQRISEGLGKFFKSATKTPTYAAQVAGAPYKQAANQYSRKAYEDTASRTEQLMSSNHQDKVRRYAKELEQQGYGDLALEVLAANQRAVQYMQYNMPARHGSKGMTSLRKHVAPSVLTHQEFKALRVFKGASDPFSLLDDLQTGAASRDQVQAAKYIYPDWHQEVVSQAAEKIYEMKSEGKYMDMGSIASLSVVLDTPLDSTMESDYIGPVQMALNTPPPDPNPPPAPNQSMPAQDLMTPLQKVQSA